jgi:hypothetical protein
MRSTTWLLAAGAIVLADLLVLGAGCGGRAGDGAAAPDSSTPESSTGPEAAVDAPSPSTEGGTLDAPTEAGATGDAGDAGAPPEGGIGIVGFGFTACQSQHPQNYCLSVPGPSFGADFYASSPVCTPMTAGACQYSTTFCGVQTSPTVSAGTLTISGGPFTATVDPRQGTGGDYAYSPPDGGVLSPGQTFTVSASGDVVPAWGPVSVVAPPMATLLSPVDSTTVASTQDLPVTWSGGQPGARFGISLSPIIGFGAFVRCDWDATLGHGVIPAVALSTALPNTGVLVTQWQVTSTTVDAGGYAVTVQAAQSVDLGLNIH